MIPTLTQMLKVLAERFAGRLGFGSHKPGREACALELYSQVSGRRWTDNPKALHIWDVSALNDIPVDDKLRPSHLLRLLEAYSECRRWSLTRQRQVACARAIMTVRRLIAMLPGLPHEVGVQCQGATTLTEAWKAVEAAQGALPRRAGLAALATEKAEAAVRAAVRSEEDKEEAQAAQSAARTAQAAAEAAQKVAAAVAQEAQQATEARTHVFIAACDLWVEAAADCGVQPCQLYLDS